MILVLDRAGCDPHKAVMIGDRLDNDVYPAKQCGMRTIWHMHGFGKFQKPRSNAYAPDLSVSDLKSLLNVLPRRAR